MVVSSVSCYNSVVVDRRSHSHAVHHCSGPCGARSQGLDCTVAHRGTCSELLVAPEPAGTDTSSSCLASQNQGKMSITLDNSYSGLERASSSGSLSLGEDGPMWRVKKTPPCGGSTATLSPSCSLKDITEEAINLASGKLKEFSFDKLRLSSSSHVTFRKGRKVRPDSFSRRSTDLEIIYGHFSSNIVANGLTNGTTNGVPTSSDENTPPFTVPKRTSAEEAGLKANAFSSITKVGGGSTGSLSSIGSLDQSLNTVASLYRNTLGEENLFARLLEKSRAEGGSGAAGGEDIRACLDILLKCSEDLKKCTDIIKQCIRHKAGGGPEDGGASPDSMYRAVMTRLSSYLKRLPLELEGVGALGGGGQGDLAELVNTLHSLQQGPFSPIFGNEQPPRYEDVVQMSPASVHKPVQSSPPRTTNGLDCPHSSQHTLSPPSSSPTRSPSPVPSYRHTPPSSPMEALYIEEEEADVGRTLEPPQRTHTPPRGASAAQDTNGTMLRPHMVLPQTLCSSGYTPTWPASAPAPRSASHRNEDIDKLLMDLESLSQSMSPPRNPEPPLPAKTRRREVPPQPRMTPLQVQKPASHLSLNGPGSRTLSLTPPQGESGEEEDGALLLRILESIESFAQELVDSGAGSTGSAERSSGKEREVMRLLQDTLATAGRAEPALDPPPPSSPAASAPRAPAVSEDVCRASPGPASHICPAPPPEPTTDHVSAGDDSAPAGLRPADFTPVAPPEAPPPVDVPADPGDAGSTLLIQQSPEVIRVSLYFHSGIEPTVAGLSVSARGIKPPTCSTSIISEMLI